MQDLTMSLIVSILLELVTRFDMLNSLHHLENTANFGVYMLGGIPVEYSLTCSVAVLIRGHIVSFTTMRALNI